jgi:hypothetical protein
VTNEKGTLPNFLVIGAMKAGTSSLYEQLRRHPQVFLPKLKEPHFFSVKERWHLGIDWYEHLFDQAGGAVALGEASVTYTLYPNFRDVPLRISEVLPDVRLIYLVRHPIDRMISHLWMDMREGGLHIQKGGEVESVDQALLTKPRFVNVSRYGMQIEQYLERFPRDHLLVIKTEDLKYHRESTLDRVFRFIRVNPAQMPVYAVRSEWNRGDEPKKKPLERSLRRMPGYRLLAKTSPEPLRQRKRRAMTEKLPPRPVISSETRQELEDRVRDDVRRLYKYMGPNFDGWCIA